MYLILLFLSVWYIPHQIFYFSCITYLYNDGNKEKIISSFSTVWRKLYYISNFFYYCQNPSLSKYILIYTINHTQKMHYFMDPSREYWNWIIEAAAIPSHTNIDISPSFQIGFFLLLLLLTIGFNIRKKILILVSKITRTQQTTINWVILLNYYLV